MPESVATEETTATVESTPSTEVSSELSQTESVADAFTDYFDDPRNDGPKPTEVKPQAEQPKESEKQGEPPKDGKEINTEGEPKPEGEQKPEPEKPDPFATAFVNEQGEIDLENILGISSEGLEFKQPEAEQQQQKQNAKPGNDLPQWQREYNQERDFRENINKSRLGPIEAAYNTVYQIEVAPEMQEFKNKVLNALQQQYGIIKSENENYFKERDQQNVFKKRQESDDKAKLEAKNAKLPELAKANASVVINNLPGTDLKAKSELYNRVMFGPDAGGPLLERMFRSQNLGIASKSKQEQDAARIQFAKELQADGEALKFHFDMAWSKIIAHPENLKRMVQKVARETEESVKSNSLVAQKNPKGQVQRQPQTGKDIWGDYMAPPETRTRI